MGWSIGYKLPKEPELLDKFFLAVGKVLYLASAFESKCRYVLRIAKLAHHFELTGDSSATWELMQALKDKLLGRTIGELKDFPEIKPTDIELLEKAKDSRNFIVHESANIGYAPDASAEDIHKQFSRLEQEVDVLISGDNVVSRWVYEINEKEPAPVGIQKVYPKLVKQWVFAVDRS